MATISRRDFTRMAAGAAVASSMASPQEEDRRGSANDRITFALIGCGGIGTGQDLLSFLRNGAECVAVCDVDPSRMDRAIEVLRSRGRKAPDRYGDFRQVLDRKDVDCVLVATPDHWHALPTILACQAGKDVYVEKPLSLTIEEGRRMVQAARKHGRVVQMGTQQRSAEHFVDSSAMAAKGELGTIRMVRCWTYLDWLGEVPPRPDAPPPADVDYDMWLGPAPRVAFNPNRFHFNFRWFWDYAGGLMTDWGAHMIDIAQLGTGAVAPRTVMSVGGKQAYPNGANETPDTQQAIFEYDGFTMIWEHALGIGRGPWQREHGVEFHGDEAILVSDRQSWEIFPETVFKGGERVYKSRGLPYRGGSQDYHFQHVQNFLDCMRTRDLPRSDVEIGHDSMKACHLANIAYRLGRTVHWDDAKEEIVGDPEAQRLVKANYRAPWTLPEV